MQHRDGPIKGVSLVNPNREPATQYEEGRVCAKPECKTVLSRYNSKPLCSLHESPTRIQSNHWMHR